MTELLFPALRKTADVLLLPFTVLPPLWGLIALSAVLGIVLLIAFRWLSPQKRLALVKDRMVGAVYEMRIFSYSPRLVLTAAGRSLRWMTEYLLLTLPALAVLAPVLGLLMVRAAGIYDFGALRPGDSALVEMDFARLPEPEDVEVEGDDGLKIRTPVVVVPSTGQAFVRIEARSQGRHRLWVKAGGQQLTKEVAVASDGLKGPVSPVRASAGQWGLLLSYEHPLAKDSLFKQIELRYEHSPLTWLALPWWAWLLVISMVVAFAFRRRLGVVI